MRTFLRAVAAIALSFGAISTYATTAQAAICCSHPDCQDFNPPSKCYHCDEECADEQITVVDEIVYDEEAGMCYPAGAFDGGSGCGE